MTTTTSAPQKQRQSADRVAAGKRKTYNSTMARLGWLFSGPALLIIAAVTIFPIIFAILMSFGVITMDPTIGFGSFTWEFYGQVFSSPKWQYAVVFTIGFTVVTVIIELVLGTLIALVLERLEGFRGWMMAILLIPWSLITVVSAVLWRYIYDGSSGIIVGAYNLFHLTPPNILGQPVNAIVGMVVADIWKTTPFVGIIVLAGLVMIPGDVYEAAKMDGATGWKIFWQVTVPLLRPTIGLAVLFRILQAFGLFDLPMVFNSGGPGYSTTSLAVLAYQAMARDLNYGGGAAVATTTAALIIIACLLFLRVFRSQVADSEN